MLKERNYKKQHQSPVITKIYYNNKLTGLCVKNLCLVLWEPSLGMDWWVERHYIYAVVSKHWRLNGLVVQHAPQSILSIFGCRPAGVFKFTKFPCKKVFISLFPSYVQFWTIQHMKLSLHSNIYETIKIMFCQPTHFSWSKKAG